jgi:hypothetical protein
VDKMANEQIQAGWYPDPTGDVTKIRYWDGWAWTDQTQPSPTYLAGQQAPQNVLQVPTQAIYAPNQAPVFISSGGQVIKDRKGMALAAMVLGIVGIPLTCCAYLSVIPGILGVIFGILGIKSSKKGMAIAGIICGAIAIVAGIAMTFLSFAILADPTNYGLPADIFDSYLTT